MADRAIDERFEAVPEVNLLTRLSPGSLRAYSSSIGGALTLVMLTPDSQHIQGGIRLTQEQVRRLRDVLNTFLGADPLEAFDHGYAVGYRHGFEACEEGMVDAEAI
jgi:hypothetical protein